MQIQLVITKLRPKAPRAGFWRNSSLGVVMSDDINVTVKRHNRLRVRAWQTLLKGMHALCTDSEIHTGDPPVIWSQ